MKPAEGSALPVGAGGADPLVETRGGGRGEAVKASLGPSQPVQTADLGR